MTTLTLVSSCRFNTGEYLFDVYRNNDRMSIEDLDTIMSCIQSTKFKISDNITYLIKCFKIKQFESDPSIDQVQLRDHGKSIQFINKHSTHMLNKSISHITDEYIVLNRIEDRYIRLVDKSGKDIRVNNFRITIEAPMKLDFIAGLLEILTVIFCILMMYKTTSYERA